jgi:oxygen-dependent protoporphyrinogen oxidase
LEVSVREFLRHPAFGLREKLRLPLLMLDVWRANRAGIDPCLVHTAADLDTESAASYIARRVGTDFLENYLEPLFRGPWNWEPEQISKAYLMSVMARALDQRIFTFRLRIGELSRTLADLVDIRLASHIESVKRPPPQGLTKCSILSISFSDRIRPTEKGVADNGEE